MWFRRRRRPALDLTSLEQTLDRAATLVEQILELIPDLLASRSPPPPPAPAAPRPAPVPAAAAPDAEPDPDPDPEPQSVSEPEPGGFVLFAGDPAGYRLLVRDGSPPECGAVLELDERRYRVLRLGPSPLPGDRRPCAFLEREEPPRTERTPGG